MNVPKTSQTEEVWYAVMDFSSSDWAYGSKDLAEARKMAQHKGPSWFVVAMTPGEDGDVQISRLSQTPKAGDAT